MSTPSPSKPPLVVSRLDYERIEALIEQAGDRAPAGLEAEIARATIVEPAQMPADVVSMNSTARVVDTATGQEREITLVYPRDVTGNASLVSILAPIGSALLGLRVGQSIEWPLPEGRRATLQVLSIEFQPEAAGQLHR